ncbi:hypothetical protein SAMN04244553_5343 [Nocardia amikacinitolerans]|uniref:Uncharacterized protein n=2 Tax=Nocardia amikacinitolerans TaxID=756689 RepID=A0A285LYG9_9NOCA|nr:hypothetical protein [Nocardia amikacinitolerans]MCP2297181.1 hypothetical protein [Nocardia amikacinitolerans]SNY88371.1 hypothetical protein SAMN04244553_5343 [Nocardia amikacinitolerans]
MVRGSSGSVAVPFDAPVDSLSDVLDTIRLRGEQLAVARGVDIAGVG